MCYIKHKERHLREQVPSTELNSKAGVSQDVAYLLVRGAHPGVNRVGIIFFAFYPFYCLERQAMQ